MHVLWTEVSPDFGTLPSGCASLSEDTENQSRTFYAGIFSGIDHLCNRSTRQSSRQPNGSWLRVRLHESLNFITAEIHAGCAHGRGCDAGGLSGCAAGAFGIQLTSRAFV
jgi:hypothetical protein